MASNPKRPPSVWIAQVILGLYGFGTVGMVLYGAFLGVTEGIPNPQLYLFTTIGVLTLAATFIGGAWGMAIRRPWGRWLGVAGLSILLIGAAITQTSRRLSDASFSYISLILSLFLVVGLAFLVYKIAVGDASEEFFSRKPADNKE